MFWGLIMEPQRRYTQKVKRAFHISMASLDISTSSEEPAQVMCGIDGRNYLLCTLRKPDVMQCSLDLNFTVGSELSFAANGKCHVHLTGYLIEDFPQEDELEEETEDEIEEPVKKKKRNNKNVKNGPPPKKSKVKDSDDNDDDDDDDSSDESDINVGDLLEKSFNEDDNDDDTYVEEEEEHEDGEEEESEDEEDEDVEEEESSLDDSDTEEGNATVVAKSNLKMNGTSSTPTKDKKKKQGTDSKLNDSKTPSKESKTPNKESKLSKKESKTPNRDQKTPGKETQSPKKKVLQGGVVVEDVKEGQGAIAKAGKFVTVYYEGRLKQNNKMFDSTTKGSGFSFRLGGGEVIKGWDVGVAGMRIGGKRKIICPPAMAYGAKGSPPAIPANSTLVFEVELKKMR